MTQSRMGSAPQSRDCWFEKVFEPESTGMLKDSPTVSAAMATAVDPTVELPGVVGRGPPSPSMFRDWGVR